MAFDDWFTLDARSGAALRVYASRARRTPRAVLLVHHGLAEHAGRYGAFAAEMAEAGFHVFAHDHRGHGSTVAVDAPFRRFAKHSGEAKVLADCRAVEDEARRRHPDLPVVVFGHSMGGIVALNYAQMHGRGLSGLAVWNCDLRGGIKPRAARAALKLEKALKGSDVASQFMRRATFDAWAAEISPRRTGFDWLSHDPAVVDAYVGDPLCGFSPTVSMMQDVVSLVLKGGSAAGLSMLPPNLPVHLLGGTGDPVSAHGEATTALAEALKAGGSRDVTLSLVAGARHETLNETPQFRQPALLSLVAWLDRVAPPRNEEEEED
ncbi:alpha/beta hydrolase [Aurantimonas sp. Leaf443]|uniref:alpha/beta fold hydrolase n=1 Tax=Aurantimonas sp. Leaf443 TaxID=1736378 RepID=UPI0006FC9422|nr:alpha/beta hydrolase [Aurantimonas sp. Leaf443]KQT86033.1 lysophospholipase [Aurantimonas sp. Leaf443]